MAFQKPVHMDSDHRDADLSAAAADAAPWACDLDECCLENPWPASKSTSWMSSSRPLVRCSSSRSRGWASWSWRPSWSYSAWSCLDSWCRNTLKHMSLKAVKALATLFVGVFSGLQAASIYNKGPVSALWCGNIVSAPTTIHIFCITYLKMHK